MLRRMSAPASRSSWLLWSPLAAAIVVFACAAEQTERPLPPASAADLALARAQRKARLEAFEEQGDRPKKSKSAPAPKPTPPPPPVEVVEEDEDEPEEALADAGAEDAGADAAPVPEGGAVDPAAMCAQLCERARACAGEMLDDAPPGVDPSLLEGMMDRMREQCMQECEEEAEDPSEAERAKAQACLDAPDCDAFLECMRELRDLE